MTLYSHFQARIKRAKTVDDFARLESSMVKLYDAGFLTPSQLMKLDCILMERQATMES
jgi:hypothetical protein